MLLQIPRGQNKMICIWEAVTSRCLLFFLSENELNVFCLNQTTIPSSTCGGGAEEAESEPT